MIPKYEEDFYGWSMAMAGLLKERRMTELDYDNLIEEIESMGRRNFDQLINRLTVLLSLLIRCSSFSRQRYEIEIQEQRIRIKDHLKENPSLTRRQEEALERGYKYGVYQVAREKNIRGLKYLEDCPTVCPYTFQQCLDDEFYPEEYLL
jgi:hypothetical protein